MLCDHNSSFMCDLEYPSNTFVIPDNDHGHFGINPNSCQLQIGSALIVQFSWICQRVVEALNHVYVGERPAVAKVFPHEKAHIVGTRYECVCLVVFSQLLFIDCRFGNPLHTRYTLEMAEGVPHYSLGRTVDWPIDHHERWVTVFYH